jgi:hypothetical protein
VGRIRRHRLDGGAADSTAGANAIGIIPVSKRDFVMQLGAKGVISRNQFDCWTQCPTSTRRLCRVHEKVPPSARRLEHHRQEQ